MNVTRDTLFNGKLVIYQELDGYRFAIDSVLLAGLTQTHNDERIVDLGCGCGIVGLIMAIRNPNISVAGIEIQKSLVELAKRNVRENNLSGVVKIYDGDMKNIPAILPGNAFDMVVSNPPYRRIKSGRINPNHQKAIARHEVSATISDVFRASAYLLKPKGRLAIIFTANRLDDMILTANNFSFAIKELRIIYSYPDGPAKLVYAVFRKGAGQEINIGPPFYVYKEKNSKEYSSEMKKLYEL